MAKKWVSWRFVTKMPIRPLLTRCRRRIRSPTPSQRKKRKVAFCQNYPNSRQDPAWLRLTLHYLLPLQMGYHIETFCFYLSDIMKTLFACSCAYDLSHPLLCCLSMHHIWAAHSLCCWFTIKTNIYLGPKQGCLCRVFTRKLSKAHLIIFFFIFINYPYALTFNLNNMIHLIIYAFLYF